MALRLDFNSSFIICGFIDELSYWNVVLNQQETNLYIYPPTGNEVGLIGYWNFNEGMEIQLPT